MSDARNDNEPVDIAPGRGTVIFTGVPEWITLSGVSATAHKLYTILRAHVNLKRGDDRSWPGTAAIAMMLGYSRWDKVSPFTKELVKLGAIDIERRGMPRRNYYTVHFTPPDDYSGPTCLADWYDGNAISLAVARAAQGDAAEAMRAKAKVSPVAPDSGLLGSNPPVAPKSGLPVAPNRGHQVAPKSGHEPDEEELDEVNETNLPPTPREDPAPTASVEPRDEGEGEDPISEQHKNALNAAAAACAELQPGWSRPGTVEAMREAIAAGRHPEAVAAAILALARGDHGATNSPNRLNCDGPWWTTRPPASPPTATVRKCWIHGIATNGGRCQQCDDEAADAAARRAAGEIPTAEESRARIRETLAIRPAWHPRHPRTGRTVAAASSAT